MAAMECPRKPGTARSVKGAVPKAPRWAVLALAGLFLAGASMLCPPAWGQATVLYLDRFEDTVAEGSPLQRWDLSGDWRFKENSACLPNEVGYTSPTMALAFDYGSTCSYRNNRVGYATMSSSVFIPLTSLSATLRWWDFVGAELGADFYSIEVSTDEGNSWPHIVLLESEDELFWDEETVDLSEFIGQSVLVRFKFESDSSFANLGWYIDDLQIEMEELPEGVSAVSVADAPPIVEGNTGTSTVNFTLDVSPANTDDISLEYITVNGTAEAGFDFVGASGPIVIPADSTTYSIAISVIGDAYFEPDETFLLEISNPSANAHITIAVGTATILDDEALVHVLEDDMDPPVGADTWDLGAGDLGQWRRQNDSLCLSPVDGFSSASYAFAYNGDEVSCTYHDAAGTTGALTMVGNVQIPYTALGAQLSFYHFLEVAYSDDLQAEVTTATVQVSTDVGLNWTTVYTFQPGEASDQFHKVPWQQEVIQLDEVIDLADRSNQSDRQVKVRFVFTQPVEVAHSAAGWYVDDVRISYAPLPAGVSILTLDDAVQNEGVSGTTRLDFPINLDPPSTQDIVLSFRTEGLSEGETVTVNGTPITLTADDIATPDVDYVSVASQVVIPADPGGVNSPVISVLMVGEDRPEFDEHFRLRVDRISTSAVLGTDSAIGVIQDDDDPSALRVTYAGLFADGAGPVPIELDEGAETVSFLVEMVPPRTVPITIGYETQDGTALSGAGLDYEAAAGTLVFPANATEASFELTIQEDTVDEDPDEANNVFLPEEFTVVFTSHSPYAADRTKQVLIHDNDVPPPLTAVVSTLTVSDAVVNEGSCPTISAASPCDSFYDATFTVMLDVASDVDISLEYFTVDGTAVAGEDYVTATGTLTFPAGSTQETVTVPIWADRTVEGDESFELFFVGPSPADKVIVEDNNGVATIRDDDYVSTVVGVSGAVPASTIEKFDIETGDIVTEPMNGATAELTSADFLGYVFDRIYGWEADALVDIDLVTGDVTKLTVTTPAAATWTGFAWDHGNGVAYGTTASGDVYAIDVASADQGTPLVSAGVQFVAVAVHPTSGRVYALEIDRVNDEVKLHEYVPGDWAATVTTVTQGGADLVLGPVANDVFWDCDFLDDGGQLLVRASMDLADAALWTLLAVDHVTGDASTLWTDLTARALAVATPPPPSNVDWTSDIVYQAQDPLGLHVIGDSASLPASDSGIGEAGAEAGATAIGVGDVNGDGFEDFVVTASSADNASIVSAGKAFLFFGGFRDEVDDHLLNYLHQEVTIGTGFITDEMGVIISGTETDEEVGISAAGVGDVNGDGIGDFILGFQGAADAGGAYLVFGSTLFERTISTADIGNVNLGALVSGVRIVASADGDEAGFSVSGAGDFNDDGFSDLIIGAPGFNGGDGAAYLIFGSSFGIGASGQLNLHSLSTPDGVRIFGEPGVGHFGADVSGAGDVNGDGVNDVVIGAPDADGGNGTVYILFGHVDYAEEDAPNPIDLARLTDGGGGTDSLAFTTVVPGHGELADLVDPPITFPDTFGSIPGELPGLMVSGDGGLFGVTAHGLGDMNGDGYGDVVMAAPMFDGSALGGGVEAHWGRFYVLFGSDGLNPDVASSVLGTDVPGLIITGVDDGDFVDLGFRTKNTVSSAGDLNGDGYMDMLIGARGATPGGYSGEAYVLYGRAGIKGSMSLRDLASPGVTAAGGRYLYATDASAEFELGKAVGPAGDVNNDSIGDFLVGHNGGAFLILGKAAGDVAQYRNLMRSGLSPLGDLGDLGGDLGDADPTSQGIDVEQSIGLVEDGSHTTPASRVHIRFTGGGSGATLAGPSTQVVTLYRSPVPDLDVGDGTPEDDARWTPAGVHWKVETNREQFSSSRLDFFYLPEDVAGFDLQDVAVFYAKPNQVPSPNTVWSWLPFTHDPDRRAFIVERDHDQETAREEFNGYYALIKADLLTTMGGVIPSVGITTENTFEFGPEVIPEQMAFWHRRDKRLYAVHAGEVTLRWKNIQGEVVSEVRAVNVWPEEDSGVFQRHVAGAPSVDLGNTDGLIEFPYGELTSTDETVVIDAAVVQNDLLFDASLTPGWDPGNPSAAEDELVTGRSMVMLSTEANPLEGDIYFQFVRTIKWNNPAFLLGGESGADWPIGLEISANTDSAYADNHDDGAGAPYVYFENGPYARASERYLGFYDRAERTGTIVPVNTLGASEPPLVLFFYEKGTRLLEAKTGNRARNPVTREALEMLDWPHVPSSYNPVWPTDVPSLVMARQDGSRELDPTKYGFVFDVYFENSRGLPGFNPNEEHAIVLPFGDGEAIFALRDDLNRPDTSEPYALLTYFDPNDGDKAKIQAFGVVAEEGAYTFSEWADVSGVDDPYEGSAGAFIQPPYPLSTFAYSPLNVGVSGPVFEDRTGRHWAQGAGDTVVGVDALGLEIYSDADIVMRFYYTVQAGFYFPDDLNYGYGTAVGDDVPWLDYPQPSPASSSGTPVNITYTVSWPEDVATMNVGDILIVPKFGLPQINGQCSVDLLYQTSVERGTGPSTQLVDPIQSRSVTLEKIPDDVGTDLTPDGTFFTKLPPSVYYRVSYDSLSQRLSVKGVLVEPGLGFPYVMLNVLSAADLAALLAVNPGGDTDWRTAVMALAALAAEPIRIADSSVDPYEALALSSGDARGVGYVTLAMQNADSCSPLPVSLEIIRVVDALEPGSIAVVTPGCVFEEKLTLMHTNDFGGKPENFEFEWLYVPDDGGTIPDRPTGAEKDPWKAPPLSTPTSGRALPTITIEGPGLLTLTDNWFAVRYRAALPGLPWTGVWSDWTDPQLAPGWIKRVIGEINPFTQRAGGGGIEGAEDSFASFQNSAPNTVVSMISQAGPPFSGAVALNCGDLDSLGLIPIYATVLDRGRTLSIDALSPVNHPLVNNALLLVASRIADLYALLANEAYADASDPTIAFGTNDGVYGAEATSIHAFMNQTSSLLEEELVLLRGRDDIFAPGTQLHPLYNRLIWNFTNDLTGGEVAYALNYNIFDTPTDLDPGGNGEISELDAKKLYPQGHGDAWGHFLTSLKTYYKLLNHPFYTWTTRSEAVLVAGAPVTVDYLDERKFATIAAGKARAGAEIVNLTYRQSYVENVEGQWQGYGDEFIDDGGNVRAWGFADWASRAGQGAYIDWVVGNAILRAEDPDPSHTSIQKIDRGTVTDLNEISVQYRSIEMQVDQADMGQNPLGLAPNAIPFDISPSDLDAGLTHFEQLLSRALTALSNAQTVFNHANNSTQLLRRQADTQFEFQRAVLAQELDFNARLIEIFGYPYAEDIGPGGAYAVGYNGPDLFHFMYIEPTELSQTDPTPTVTWSVDVKEEVGVNSDGTLVTNLLTGGLRTVDFTVGTAGGRYGLLRPPGWSQRRAPGQLQEAISNLILATTSFETAIDDYNGWMGDVEGQVEILAEQYGLNVEEIRLMNAALGMQRTLQGFMLGSRIAQVAFLRAASIAEKIAAGISEGFPRVTGLIVGFSNGIIFDTLAPARGGIKLGALVAAEVLAGLGDVAGIVELTLQQALDQYQSANNILITTEQGEFAGFKELKQLESMIRSEFPLRMAIYSEFERMNQTAGRYLALLTEGLRVVDRRDIFRKQTSADTQMLRYKDMAFRIFRNDALQKYRAQFDLAARYTYLAAKAYDYETTLLPSDSMAGQQFLSDIVRARQLGTFIDGEPQTGRGLADPLARMSRNFDVLLGQLGFNNPQVETNRFSLRYELFRVLPGAAGDESWRDTLWAHYVDNLWDVTEFRRYCVPAAGFRGVEPGLVIPFSTMIVEGMNFFGQEAGGLDNAYDSTQFATKIRSVGIWFSNYDFLGLSNTPRVYLVPTGIDVLRSPTDYRGRTREFKVLDQILPIPFPIGENDLTDPNWLPMLDSTNGQFSPIRRYGRIRAYHDSGEFDVNEVSRDSRLVGRSVWNTKWLLIIPASTLHNDRETGMNLFIDGPQPGGGTVANGIADIKIFFETYAYPRLKSDNQDGEQRSEGEESDR